MSFLEDIKISGRANALRVNKFGSSPNVDDTTDTDLWDAAATPIWLAPTAARTHAFVSTDATDTVADCVLTFTQQPGNTETITIGTKVYTFQTTLTDVDGNVLISAVDASGSLDNLIAAITLTGTAGTDYALAMTANDPETVAAAGDGDTMVLWDETSAIIATTSTVTGGTWATATTLGGTGARTVRFYGLKTWTSAGEESEDVGLHGTVAVTPATTWVIIYRVKVLTSGTTKRNAGIISATATTDATVTAQIAVNKGQSKMAVYAVPSGSSFHLKSYYGSVLKAAAALRCSFTLMLNPEPQTQTTMFNEIHDWGLDTTGNSWFKHEFGVPNTIAGPCIIKLQGNATANDTTAIGGFSGVVTNDSLLALEKA